LSDLILSLTCGCARAWVFIAKRQGGKKWTFARKSLLSNGEPRIMSKSVNNDRWTGSITRVTDNNTCSLLYFAFSCMCTSARYRLFRNSVSGFCFNSLLSDDIIILTFHIIGSFVVWHCWFKNNFSGSFFPYIMLRVKVLRNTASSSSKLWTFCCINAWKIFNAFIRQVRLS